MDQSSPFLRLPLELRRRIFEFLPVRTKLVTTFKDRTKYPVGKKIPVLVLVLRYVERNIIQTCRQLAEEAEPILEIETMKLGPPSFIIRARYVIAGKRVYKMISLWLVAYTGLMRGRIFLIILHILWLQLIVLIVSYP